MKIEEYSVLIVEDELIAMEYLKQILHILQVKEVFEASSASEAMQIATTKKIDLAFMDININGPIDGIECATLLNKEFFLPIIFTTAYGDTNTIEEAQEESVFGYIIKPFDPSDVEACLNVALRMIRQSKELSNLNEKKEISEQVKKVEKTIDLDAQLKYNFDTRTLTSSNELVALTKKELDLLDIFCSNVGKTISYKALKDKVWQTNTISNSTIRDTVSRLKKKIPNVKIQNVSNLGYLLKKIV